MKKKWRRWKRQSLKNIKEFTAYTLLIVLLAVGTILIFGSIGSVTTSEVPSEQKQHEAFIAGLVPKAKELQASHGIWPSVMLAQAALESNWGESELAQEANNLFGIKSSGEGEAYPTKEYDELHGWHEIQATFKNYDNAEQSMDDYADLIQNGTDWNPSLYHGVVDAQNYEEAAQALAQAGYATDPDYAEKLIDLINTYHLYQYD